MNKTRGIIFLLPRTASMHSHFTIQVLACWEQCQTKLYFVKEENYLCTCVSEFNAMLEFCCKAIVLDKKTDLIYNQVNSREVGRQAGEGEGTEERRGGRGDIYLHASRIQITLSVL